jgi:hypothetical protein
MEYMKMMISNWMLVLVPIIYTYNDIYLHKYH